MPPPNWVVMLKTAEVSVLTPDSRRTDLGGQVRQVLRQVRPLEEPLGLLVVRRGAAVADLVEVDGELGGVQRPALAQVFAGRHDRYQGFRDDMMRFQQVNVQTRTIRNRA